MFFVLLKQKVYFKSGLIFLVLKNQEIFKK